MFSEFIQRQISLACLKEFRLLPLHHCWCVFFNTRRYIAIDNIKITVLRQLKSLLLTQTAVHVHGINVFREIKSLITK